MPTPNEKQALPAILDQLAELLGLQADVLNVQRAEPVHAPDFIVEAGKTTFVIEYRHSASAGGIAGAIQHLENYARTVRKSAVCLIVVPFMEKAGRELCDKAQVSWLDLSGNARITAPGLRVWIEGRPNKYSRRGRPLNVFAHKSSRITRLLLLDWKRFQTQANLARAANLDDGYVSKVVRRLVDAQLIVENDQGAVRPRDPSILLDAWASEYDFQRHQIIKGTVAARTGEELVSRLVEKLEHESIEYALTGLAAAWLANHFAAFRLGTIYVRSRPSKSFFESIEFWEEEKGANLWFVVPNDEGVFQGSQHIDDKICVSDVQIYLDLKAQPERAQEAAEKLRQTRLNWQEIND